jgi:hypothetical protein
MGVSHHLGQAGKAASNPVNSSEATFEACWVLACKPHDY